MPSRFGRFSNASSRNGRIYVVHQTGCLENSSDPRIAKDTSHCLTYAIVSSSSARGTLGNARRFVPPGTLKSFRVQTQRALDCKAVWAMNCKRHAEHLYLKIS